MSTEELPPRESMEFDVVIVGAGPSGLAAAIRLKQLNPDLGIVVVEKGSEVGAHILSGAVIDPVALDRLIPDWREDADCPLKTQVKDDRFYWMTAGTAIRLPNIMMLPLMNNYRCYVGSLGNVCRWVGGRGEGRGRAAQPDQRADRKVFPRCQQRTAEIRHRAEGGLADRSGQAPERSDPAFVRLAVDQFNRRRLVPLSLRR